MHKANGITRNQILTSIKVNGSMTADTLAQELGISPVAVRQHLSALEAEGYIRTSVERRGLGRPVHRYTVTDEGDESFPRTYDRVSNELLDELRLSGGEAAVDAVFAARRERLQAANLVRVHGKPLLARVQELARLQSEYGYMAESQEDGEDLLLVEHNCAICKLARQNRTACQHELIMLQNMVGDSGVVTRERYILDGDPTCTYRIKTAT